MDQIADNKLVAYILNFLAGCEGKLGVIGSMSKIQVFSDGEWWRLFLHYCSWEKLLKRKSAVWLMRFKLEKRCCVQQEAKKRRAYIHYSFLSIVTFAWIGKFCYSFGCFCIWSWYRGAVTKELKGELITFRLAK